MEFNDNYLDKMRLTFSEESFEWNKYNIRNLLIYSKLPINMEELDEEKVRLLFCIA